MNTQTTQPTLKEMIAEEYAKCVQDPAYFIKKYCYIQHPVRGKIKFMLYPFQENVLWAFVKHTRNIILKNRQMGLSTLSAAYSLWLMTFFNDKNIYVIATKQEVAKNIISKVKMMHHNLPSWLKQKCVEDNKLGQKYNNGSRIFAGTSATDAGRSEAVSLLILDEAAFIPKMSDLWGALQPTISTGGDIIVLSTPNGVGNWFHQSFLGAEEDKNNFFPITLHWTLHPERDQTWRDEQDKELGIRLARQECDGSFLASGDTVIASELLEWYKQTHTTEPNEKTGFDRNVWIWEYPTVGKKYAVSADVARGDGKDYSTFEIFNIETLEQVAEYQGKIGTKEFGNLLIQYATAYNDALLIVENVGIGWAVIQEIVDRKYKNIFYTDKKTMYIDNKVEQQYMSKYNRLQNKAVPGFSTGTTNRPLIISKMEQYFNERTVNVRSTRLINELFTFIWNAGKPEAASGYNDDLVMAFAILLWVRDVALRLQQQSQDLTKATIDNFKVDREQPNFVSTKYPMHDPHHMPIGNNETLDLRQF